MSTLNVTNIQHESASGNNIVLDSNGNVTCAGDIQSTSQNGGQLAGFRNVLINGDFRVWQRGVTFTFAGGPVWTADRWRTYGTGTGVNVRSQDVPANEGFTFSLLSSLPTQPIELQDAGFASQFSLGSIWTLSCWAKTTTPAKAILAFADNSEGLNQGASFGGGEQTMTAIETKGDWVKYSATFTCDQSPAGTNKCLRAYTDTKGGMVLWTGFQLEPGPVATPFEHRPIATELALCQRFYYEMTASANGKGLTTPSMCLASSTTAVEFFPTFPVPLRAAPTVNLSGVLAVMRADGGSGKISLKLSGADFAMASSGVAGHLWFDRNDGSSGFVAGNVGRFVSADSGQLPKLTFDAEL